jgi:hypothetical protein
MHRQQVSRIAVDLEQPLLSGAGRWTLEQPPARAEQREADLMGAQRKLRDDAGDLRGLGLVGFQELAARREIEEQVADLDARALGRPHLHHRCDGAAVHLDLRSGHRAARPGPQRQVRHRGNRRQRLAPEPQRRDGAEVPARADLARGMPLERQPRVVRIHPFPVVFDPDRALAAVLDGDRNPGGAGVEGVFDQLFDHRGGPFDDFAGGDLVGELH